ncbi:MAG: lysophospholipase [Cyanobacteria bacterium]|nr:lysophospholipase [Cyanobacteriota bacterium]
MAIAKLWLGLVLKGLGLGLLGLGLAYGAICGWLWWRQPQLVFAPLRSLTENPADFGLSYEDLWIPVGGDRLHGWRLWQPSAGPARGTILYFHGNAEHVGSNLRRLATLTSWGYEVVAVDYRGYGRSGGPFPNEARVYEDARAIWRYGMDTLGLDPRRTIFWGHSLGGAIAIDLLSHQGDDHPRDRRPLGGLVVEASFTAIADLAKENPRYGLFPIDWLVHQRFASIEKVHRLTVPTLYIHGTDDELIPPAMSDRLAAATPGAVEVLRIPGADHNNALQQGGDRLRDALANLPQTPSISSTGTP